MKKVKITGSKRLGFEWWGDKLRGRIVDVYDYPYFTKKGKKYYEMVTSGKRKFIPAEYCVNLDILYFNPHLFKIE